MIRITALLLLLALSACADTVPCYDPRTGESFMCTRTVDAQAWL